MTSIATHIVAPPRRRFLQVRTIWLLVRKELRDSLRNRWFLLYTMAFTALAFGLAYLSQIGTGYGGLAGFGKTAASLVNLTLLIVPLMAVTMGALSLSSERERGMLAYMLAQPVTRTEVFLSKFIGQGIAFAGTIAIGFGSSAALLSRQGADGEIFLRLAGLSL
ncbi:MAG: ABC transporter permease subunit, partial [Phycisphaeraceae bacterium]|nr:ABC transporter permease subunit [Phycisphaeraceae bacterium]